jgi:aspartate/methionine/tyrosine aminotransferase
MKIKQFLVEDWMNTYEMDAVYNLAETCVDSFTLGELVSLSGDPEKFMKGLHDKKLTYGHIEGSPELRGLVASLYSGIGAGNVLVTQGGIGANFLVLFSLIKPGDRVVCVHPTYQQLYSVPEAFGARVTLLGLKPENGFLPDMDELRCIVKDGVDMIILNNPNNPTGALMEEEMLREIADIADKSGAYILCDEVYRGLLHHEDMTVPSIVDIYDRGISTGSMSKVYSLAGLRLGWIAGPEGVIKECFRHRDYVTISCGMLDDTLSVLALKNCGRIMERNLGIIRKNADVLYDWVSGQENISYVRPKAGTTAFLKYEYPIASDKFCLGLFKKNGTMLVPGKCFDMDGWLRMGYACDTGMLKKGLEKLTEYTKTLE